MKNLQKLFAASAAFVALSAAAQAAECPPTNPCPDNQILNGQLSIGTTVSNLATSVSDISGKVTATAAAIGNSFSVDVAGDTAISNNQQNYGYVGASLNATVARTKEVSLTAAAIGNSASIKVKGADSLVLNNYQNQQYDPSAYLASSVSDITGNVTQTAAAIANSLSVDTDAEQLRINSYQRNYGPNVAGLNSTVTRVAGDVALTSAAIANSVSIKSGM